MTVLWSETWSYTNGTSPSTVAAGLSGTGSSATVQSNKLRLTAGSVGGTGKVSRRAVMTAASDVEVTGSLTVGGTSSNDSVGGVHLRSESQVDGGNGYILSLRNESGTMKWTVDRAVNYVYTNLLAYGTNGLTATPGTVVNYRFRVVGAVVQARVWTGATEPSTWGLNITDGSPYTTAGAVGWSHAETTGTSLSVDVGAVTITDGAVAATPATGSGSLTLAASATGRGATPGATGALALSASGTVQGTLTSIATSSLSLSATGAAVGVNTPVGSLTLGATGSATTRATGSAPLTLSATLTARAPVTGSASITLAASGTAAIPAPSLLWNETWLYNDGVAPATIAPGFAQPGSSAQVRNQRLRLTTGDAVGGAGKVSRRIVLTPTTDYDVQTSVLLVSTTGDYTGDFHIRAESAVDGQYGYSVGYRMNLDAGTFTWYVVKAVNYTYTMLYNSGTVAGITAGSTIGIHFRVVGNVVQARVWDTVNPEPGAWPCNVTDATPYSTAGYVGMDLSATNGLNRMVEIEPMTVTNGSVANNPPTANAGPDQTNIAPFQTVYLTGSGSDSDGSVATYNWSQVSGPPVVLTRLGPNVSFPAPAVLGGGTVVLQLIVTDNNGASSAPDTVSISITRATLLRNDGAGWFGVQRKPHPGAGGLTGTAYLSISATGTVGARATGTRALTLNAVGTATSPGALTGLAALTLSGSMSAAGRATGTRSLNLSATGTASVPVGPVSATSSAPSAFASATSVSYTQAAPSNLVAGNLLVAFQYVASSSSPNLTGPAGWTQAGTVVGNSGGGGWMKVWTKTVTSAEQTSPPASYSFGGTNSSAIQWWVATAIVQYTGLVEAAAVAGNSSATYTTGHDAPTVTTPESNDYLICAFGQYEPFPISVGPAGMTLRTSAFLAGNEGIAVYDEARPTAGATGTRTATSSSADATMAVSVALRRTVSTTPPPTLTRLPMQPAAIYYGNLTGPATTAYRQPGALVVTSRGNFGNANMIAAASAGAHVIGYFDAIVWAVFGSGDVTGRLFNSSIYGPAVPEWPGPITANDTGNLADFRPSSVMHQASSTNSSWTKLEAVLESIVAENPHLSGFFADDLGSRSWFPNFSWDTFGSQNQSDYRAGAVLVLQAFRRVCNRHNMFLIVNGTWTAGTLAASGGGYPTLGSHGCSLADGGVWEHHGSPDSFSNSYFSGTQWASGSTLTGTGNAFHLVIGDNGEDPVQWANTGNYAWFNQQTDYTVTPPTPWGSFHVTGLPTGDAMSPPSGAVLTNAMLNVADWDAQDPAMVGFSTLSGSGPGGDPILRNTLVDGQRPSWDPPANERNDRSGPDVPNGGVRWMTWYERIISIPSNLSDGGWMLMGPNEIHGQTLTQATFMPLVGTSWDVTPGGTVLTGRKAMDANAGRDTHLFYDVGPVDLGNWHQYKFGVFYTTASTGWWELWRDGVRIIRFDGITTTESVSGYWKWGNYRNAELTGTSTYDISGVRIYRVGSL